MEIKIKSYSSQSSLLSSILFFILGAILFTSADQLLDTVSIIIGTILAILGSISLIIYFFQCKNPGIIPKKGNLIFGVIAFILAIIFIFFHDELIEPTIRFIIGGWILLTGIIRLINVLSMNKKDNKFFQLLIVAILLIIIGIYTIVQDFFGIDILGIVMMLYAAVEIVGYILYSKDKPTTTSEETPGTTTLLVPENTDENNKNNNKPNIKDVKEKKKKKRLKEK